MREIKFRFFRKLPSPLMIYPDSDFFIEACTGKPCGLIRYTDKIEIRYLSLIPMQYTGSKDILKKEVYEDDIVNLYENKLAIVKFNNETASFYLQDLKNDKCSDHLYGIYLFEVIGNKWENPELLKGEFDG